MRRFDDRESETDRRIRQNEDGKREFAAQQIREHEENERQRASRSGQSRGQHRRHRSSSRASNGPRERRPSYPQEQRPHIRTYTRPDIPPRTHDFQRSETAQTESSRFSFDEQEVMTPQQVMNARMDPHVKIHLVPDPLLIPTRKPVEGGLVRIESPTAEARTSRLQAFKPTNVYGKVMHWKQRSDSNADLAVGTRDEANAYEEAGNVDSASTRGTVGGDDTPPGSQTGLGRNPNHDYSTFDAVRKQERSSRGPDPDRHVQGRSLPPPSVTQVSQLPQGSHQVHRNGSISQQYQLPVTTFDTSQFSKDAEGKASEIDGQVLSSASPSQHHVSNLPDSALQASRDLFYLCETIKRIEPTDADLAKCLSAEKAVKRLADIYHKTVNGWTTEFHRADRFERLASEVEQTRKKNQELTTRNALLETREELLMQTKKNNAALEFDVTKQRDDHTAALNAQKQYWENKLAREKGPLSEEISRLANEIEALRRSNDRLRQTASDSQHDAGRLNLEVNRLNEAIKTTISRHEGEVRRDRQDRELLIAEKREQMAALEITHANDTRDLRATVEKFEAEREGLEVDYNDKLDQLNKEHAKAMSDLKFEHEQAMIRTADDNKDTEQQLVERYQKQIAEKDRTLQRLKDSIQGQVAEQTRRYKDKISALNSQIDDLEANARKVEDRARRQFEDQEKRLKQTHQQEMRAVKQEKENLVGALVERSAFKGIADHVVEARFKKLAKAVDQFARTCTNWDKNREMDWPCSENVLRTHENPRQMKQYFIQNNVWTLLYDNIFNTPFQCFGDDGQTYYEEWIGTFGENPVSVVAPHWPEADKKSEEWRYTNVQKCMDAVEKPLGDPGLKRAYIQTREHVGEDITRALGRMIVTSTVQQKAVKDIVHQAAKLWLDLGIQRCRIIVAVPQGIRGVSRRQDGQRIRELVVQPEVLRFGNAQGEGLDTQEVVICKMDVHKLR